MEKITYNSRVVDHFKVFSGLFITSKKLQKHKLRHDVAVVGWGNICDRTLFLQFACHSVQSFIGKNLHAGAHWTDNLERSVRYGCAFYSPVPGIEAPPGSAIHFFVEALGRSRLDDNSTARPVSPGEILPGLHWRVGENWWMSGAVIVPLGPNRFSYQD